MLVLSRKKGECITINRDISVSILSIDGDRVRVGIRAPKEVRIFRKELLEETIDTNRAAIQAPIMSFKKTNSGS